MMYIWKTKKVRTIFFWFNCRECGERLSPDNFTSGFCEHCLNEEVEECLDA